MQYRSSSHAKFRSCIILFGFQKYRKRLLEGRLAKRIEELIMQCAEMNGWYIQELNIQPDHVHLLLEIKPSISVSKAMQYLKGGSSRVIREEFPELEEFLWGESFWGDGYFAETVGKVDEAIIRNYVKNQ